jgi:inorganic pyrophosphatase
MDFNVLIEIPKGTKNNKYEYDHKTGKMVLDFVFENLTYPYNYGEAVGTMGGDGDALDVLVFSEKPLEQSMVVKCAPFGIMKMLDRGEVDDKLLAVPLGDSYAEKYKDITDFSEEERKQVREFNQEIARQKKKHTKILGFFGKEEALEEIKKSII